MVFFDINLGARSIGFDATGQGKPSVCKTESRTTKLNPKKGGVKFATYPDKNQPIQKTRMAYLDEIANRHRDRKGADPKNRQTVRKTKIQKGFGFVRKLQSRLWR
jgi:hypothetical protein